MCVYVDDFKLSGPTEHHDTVWALLGEKIDLSEHTAVKSYLGCQHDAIEKTLADGTLVKGISYNMEEFIDSCLERYQSLSPSGKVIFKPARTPFASDQEPNNSREPMFDGAGLQCGWCQGIFPEDTFKKVLSSTLNQKTRCHNPLLSELMEEKEMSSGERVPETCRPEDEKVKNNGKDQVGEFSSCAAKIVMKIFWCARYARFDILRAVGNLSRYLTRWTPDCDRSSTDLCATCTTRNTTVW